MRQRDRQILVIGSHIMPVRSLVIILKNWCSSPLKRPEVTVSGAESRCCQCRYCCTQTWTTVLTERKGTLAKYRGADKSLARPGRKHVTGSEVLIFIILFIIIIGGTLLLFLYITRLASNEIFSPSNKIWEVGRAKDLWAHLIQRTKRLVCQKEHFFSNFPTSVTNMNVCPIKPFMEIIPSHTWLRYSTTYLSKNLK